MKKIILLALLWTAFQLHSNAQSFQLVNDLYPATENLLYDYDAGMTFDNGKLYFTSYYGDIVVSDGTSAGTSIISNNGMQKMTALDFKKNRFVPMGGKMYYINHRNELSVTDGTSSGTSIVVDIHPTDSTNFFGVKTILGAGTNQLFFVGNDGVHGFELWVSDGTAAGTQMVNDMVTGMPGFFASTPKHHIGTIINDKLYFFAKDATNGYEPWVSDGTPSGTIMLANTNPNGDCSAGMASTFGGFAASEMKFFEFNNTVYFVGFSGIYKTDGTTAGTTLEINGASYGANVNTSMCVFNNHLYFNQFLAGKNLLTKSDGTLAGSVIVDTLSGTLSRGFQEFNGELYFRCKPNAYSSSDKDYIAKLSGGSQIDSLTASTSGYYNYPVNIVQPISSSDFLYMGNYSNHAIYYYNNGANTIANNNFTSVYDNLLSTPIGTFAIGTNATYGYELWKWDNSTTGLEGLKLNHEIKLYPNPVKSELNLKLSHNATVLIINLMGEKVLTLNLKSGNNIIQTEDLASGLYFLQIENGETLRFVRE